MENEVRWGLMSTARINRRIIPAVNRPGRSSVVAVASRSLNKAREYAKDWGIPRAYGDYDELLSDASIDVIYLSLPNDMHTEWTIRSLEAGKHVLCEKPLCLTVDDAERITRVAQQTGQVVMEGFMYLHHPQMGVLKEIINTGRIGELRAMRSAFTFNFTRERSNYRMLDRHGGGALWDVGVYPVSLFQFLTNSEPLHVAGMALKDSVDWRFAGILAYPNGVSGEFTCGFDASYSNFTVIHGSTGYVTLSHPFTAPDLSEMWLYSTDGKTRIELPSASLYQPEVDNMNDVALGQAIPLIGLERSIGHIRTVNRLRKSALEIDYFT